MNLRPAKKEELDRIYDICLSIKEIYRKNKIDLWNDDYPLREDFELDLNNNKLFAYVIRDEIIGSVSYEDKLFDEDVYEDDVAATCRLMVKPQLQNQGIGTKIIEELQMILRSRNIKQIKFLVSKHNPKAMALYQRLGFINYGLVKTPWNEELTYYLFRKNLEENK